MRVGDDLADEIKPALELVLVAASPSGRPMKIWRCTGSVALTISDSEELSTGTERQPRNSSPSSRMMRVHTRSQCARRRSSLRHEEVADGIVAGLRQLDPSFAHSSLRKSCGIWMRMPAPSPAIGSAPTAPRCSRFSRMSSASLTIWCDLRALQVGDEADAAGVVLALGIEQAARFGDEVCGIRLLRARWSTSLPMSWPHAFRLVSASQWGHRFARAPERPRYPRRSAGGNEPGIVRSRTPPLHGPPSGLPQRRPLSSGSDGGCAAAPGGAYLAADHPSLRAPSRPAAPPVGSPVRCGRAALAVKGQHS